MLRYGLEILRASLGSELHVCRQLDLERTVEEVMGDLQRGKGFGHLLTCQQFIRLANA